jgi:hypothetical protein
MIAAKPIDAPGVPRAARARRRLLLGASLVALLCAAAPSSARADDAAARNLAEQLFSEGRKLMEAGKLDEACPKLAESQRLDPAGGTLLNLAVCHEGQGHFASAWSEFREALAVARNDARRDREQLALEHLKQIEPKVSHLTLAVDAAAGAEGLTIKLDGEAIGPAAWSSRLPVDPGAHQIVASAPGKLERRVVVQVMGIADSKVVPIPPLDDAPVPAHSVAVADSTPPPDHAKPQTGKRVGGAIVGGLGLVALGVGTFFGIDALQRRRDSDGASCSGSTCTTQRGVDLNNDAERFATYADVAIGVGILGLVVGSYLVFTSGASPTVPAATALRVNVSPHVGPRGSGLELSGTF